MERPSVFGCPNCSFAVSLKVDCVSSRDTVRRSAPDPSRFWLQVPEPLGSRAGNDCGKKLADAHAPRAR